MDEDREKVMSGAGNIIVVGCDFLRGQRDIGAYCRVVEADRPMIAVVNASAAPFEQTSPEVSRRLLDHVEEVWAANAGHPIAARAAEVFQTLSASILKTFSPGDEVTCWVSIVVPFEDHVEAWWLSGDELRLMGDGRILERTGAATIGQHTGQANAPNVLTIGLGSGYTERPPQSLSSPWKCRSGMRLVLTSHSVAELFDEHELLSLESTDANEFVQSVVASVVDRGALHGSVVVVDWT
jgi:hypothetical protein